MVASTTGGPLNAADQSAIARRVTALRRVASVERAEETKVSPSGSAAQIAVTASVAGSDIKAQKTLVAGIDSALARAGTAPGVAFHLAGAVATNVASQNSSSKTGHRVQSLSLLLIIVLLLGVLTLLLASFGIYHDLGIPLAVGVGVMLLAGLTPLPALLATFGQAAFWPRRPHRRDPDRIGVWGAIAARIVRRPAVTLGIGVLAFAAVASAALGYHSGGFGGATSAPTGSGAATGNAIVVALFPRSSANPANLVLSYPRPVWTDPGVLVRAGNPLAGSHRFTQLSGPLDPNGTALSPAQLTALHSRLGPLGRLPAVEPASAGVPAAQYNAYRATAVFVSPNGRVVQFEATLRAGAQTTTAALDATPAIRHTLATAAAASGATASGVAGQPAALYDVSATSSHDLVTIGPIAIVAIALLLALVLRSLVAPLYLIVSGALSYLAALGLSTLAFIDIGGDGGSGGTQIQAIGFGLAIGILMDTFVVRTVLVPSAVALVGRYNWWPAGMSRRPAHAPREGLRPGGGHDAVLEEAPDLRA